MAEGSLFQQLQTLQSAVAGVVGLLGTPSQNGSTGSGLAGAASLAATSPNAQVAGFGTSLSAQMSGIFTFEGAAGLEGVPALFSMLRTGTQAVPSAAFETFTQRLTQTNGVFAGDFLRASAGNPRRHPEHIARCARKSHRCRRRAARPDLNVLGSWKDRKPSKFGPGSSRCRNASVLMPLIAQAQAAPDPAAIVQQVVQRSLNSILEVFGFGQVQGLLDFLDTFPGQRCSGEAHWNVHGAHRDRNGIRAAPKARCKATTRNSALRLWRWLMPCAL